MSGTAEQWMPRHATSPAQEMILCNTCISTCSDFQSQHCKKPLASGPPFLKSDDGQSLTLNYEAEDEDCIVKEILTRESGQDDTPPLTVSFLLSTCLQHSSACLHSSDLRRLLLLIASGVQSAVWVSGEAFFHCRTKKLF